jgi:signal transduction histidine kinase
MARRHLVWLAGAAALASTALAVSTVVGAALDDVPGSFAQRVPTWLLVAGLAGLAMMVAAGWLLAASRPIASIGLAIGVAGTALPVEAARSGVPAPIQAVLVGFVPLVVAGVGLVGVGWLPQLLARRWTRLALALVAASITVHVLAYDPFADPGCVLTCEAFVAPAEGLLSTRAAATVSAVLAVLAGLVIGAEVLSASRGRGLVTNGLLVALAALAAGWLIRVIRWDALASPTLLVLPVVAAAAAIGVTTFAATVRERRVRREVRRVVDGLEGTGSIAGPGTIREVQFAMPDGRWVDEHGHDAADVRDGQALVITNGDDPAVRLVLGPGVDHGSVELAMTPAARLALRNAQLAALARARLGEVQASRRRIIEVSDAERARIERDLHDGAQQRLVAATFHLNVALNRGVGTVGGAAQADDLVRTALSNLRQLAHGIFPATLSTNGLGAALDELVGASDARVTLDVDDVRLAPDTAFAAYELVAAALEAAHPDESGQVDVRVIDAGSELAVEVDIQGAPFADEVLVDVADRVAALDGSLTTARDDGVTKVRARLPCGS